MLKRFIIIILLSAVIPAVLSSCVGQGSGDTASGDSSQSADITSAEPHTAPETEGEEEILMNKVNEILAGMTLAEKVGQMFIARYPQTGRDEAVTEYALGGFTWYAVNFENETPQSVTDTIRACQSLSKIPMFMAVDEEGGTVTRVSCFKQFRSERFGSPSEVYAAGGLEACAADAAEKSRFLLALGLNLNFAPVCDMSYSADNYIHKRTLGQDVATTCDFISVTVSEMNKAGIGCSVKHFPGYGDNVDTHSSIAYDDRTLEQFTGADILPFTAGIKAGAGIVMVAHNIVQCMDAVNPASLSAEVHRMLREELGFDGVIMTDSLDMGGITKFVGESSAAVQAVLAGNDFLCCTSYKVQIPAVLDAVRNGVITEERIDDSVRRIIALKIRLGIIE